MSITPSLKKIVNKNSNQKYDDKILEISKCKGKNKSLKLKLWLQVVFCNIVGFNVPFAQF